MKNVFVFPCGSEIALEIARSLEGDRHFNLIGGSSVDDHGRFVFKNVIENIPWATSKDFLPTIKRIVHEYKIDFIYPALDNVLSILKDAEDELGAYVVSSPKETTKICLSKKLTYKTLFGVVKTPKVYSSLEHAVYPLFVKPDIGYGSRGTAVIHDYSEANEFLLKNKDVLLLELLTGEEYTVDCFTDRHGKLLFSEARVRGRTTNGISVRTSPVSASLSPEFQQLASKINSALKMRGAWFVQFKRNAQGELTLLEVAARFGGSSGLYRGLGVNFALLSLWDALDCDVSISPNDYDIVMDRALDNQYKLGINYDEVFLDYDDTIVMSADGTINPKVMEFVFCCINRGIKITVLSRHRGDLLGELKSRHIGGLFSRLIHIDENDDKVKYIDNSNSIFIDDSYAERMRVRKAKRIPVFGLDMIDALISSCAHIAAGAVVPRPIPPHVLAAGVPAQVKKELQ